MKQTSRALWLGVAASLALTACGRWKDLSVADGLFTIKTPPGIALNCQQQSNPEGWAVQGCTSDSKDVTYIASSDKFPSQLDQSQVGGNLGVFIDFEATHSGSQVVSTKDIVVNGWKGKDFVLKGAHGEATGRVFMGRNYEVNALAVAKTGAANKNDILHFVSSLQPLAK